MRILAISCKNAFDGFFVAKIRMDQIENINERSGIMRKRNIQIIVRLNHKEQQHLTQQVKKTGLSQEAFIRALINGYVPKPLPPPDYHLMIKELHAIGNNLNQIAARANAMGHIDKTVFQYEVNRLRKALLDIQAAVTLPERRNEDGNNSNMGCVRPP